MCADHDRLYYIGSADYWRYRQLDERLLETVFLYQSGNYVKSTSTVIRPRKFLFPSTGRQPLTIRYFGSFIVVALTMLSGLGVSSQTTILFAANPVSANSETDTAKKKSDAKGDPKVNADGKDGNDARVLRHAVFFEFKEDSSKQEIQEVIEAFEALPRKIDAIKDFQWGVNNSPEGFDDGFTHCFLLTFADEAGREEYLPHPAHAGEFVGVLRPHLKDVFVIDYWGKPSESEGKKLKHAVFFKFKDAADPAEIQKVEEAFAALPEKIDAITDFEWGKNNSPEKHDDGFTHAFMVTFDSEEGRTEYLPHPAHKQFVEVLTPVLDKVRVLDFWVE